MDLPDIEAVAAKVHEAWMESKRAQGFTSRKSEGGEELMVPYERLSEAAKELDRATVRAVYAALAEARARRRSVAGAARDHGWRAGNEQVFIAVGRAVTKRANGQSVRSRS